MADMKTVEQKIEKVLLNQAKLEPILNNQQSIQTSLEDLKRSMTIAIQNQEALKRIEAKVDALVKQAKCGCGDGCKC